MFLASFIMNTGHRYIYIGEKGGGDGLHSWPLFTSS